jgi:hypothetical protein
VSPQDSSRHPAYPVPPNVNNPVETESGPPGTRYRYRYHWAADLFDHLTVHSPNNDFLPNVTPSLYKTPAGALITPSPQAVSNSGGIAGNSDPLDPAGAANDYAEDSQPVDGLVNINTAPWKVLAALPMVLNPDGSVNVERNAELAKAIVYFRDVHDGYQKDLADKTLYPHGPFTSVADLNAVWDTRPTRPGFRDLGKYPGPGTAYGFRNGYGLVNLTGGTEPGVDAGDLAPNVRGKTDGVRADFEEQYLVFNRISNLITTRSDSFTCYVYVMGVAHDGAPDAEIKVQRRVAFIADRSGVRPLRPVVRTLFFNND